MHQTKTALARAIVLAVVMMTALTFAVACKSTNRAGEPANHAGAEAAVDKAADWTVDAARNVEAPAKKATKRKKIKKAAAPSTK